MTESETKAIAHAHWDFIEALLGAHNEPPEIIERCKFHYISAWVHGAKHERESTEGFPEEILIEDANQNPKFSCARTRLKARSE